MINCPKCNSLVPEYKIQRPEGIATCGYCGEIFRIDAHYYGGKKEERIEGQRITKPGGSPITVQKEYTGGHTIVIPATGWTGGTVFILFFAVVWNSMSWSFLISNFPSFFSFFMLPFLAIGFFLIGVLFFMTAGKTIIHINGANIETAWQVFQFKYKQVRNTSNFEEIKSIELYKQNNSPVYGLGMFFKGESTVKFGSDLKEEEKKWLISEITRLRNQYAKRQSY